MGIMTERKDTLFEEMVQLKELNDISEELGDPNIDKTLVNVVKIMSNPNIAPEAAALAINAFTAQYFVYKAKYKYYMLHKDEHNARMKKEYYATIADALLEVIQSLKYVTRLG